MKKRQSSNSSLRDMIDSAFTSDSKKHIKLSSTPDMATEQKHAFGDNGENVSVIYVDGRLPGGQPLPDRRIARGSTENLAINQATFPPLTFLDQRISSSLQSNLNSASNRSCTYNSCVSGKEFNDAASCTTSTSAFASNADTPSATLGILDRLVHWLLFPMTNSTIPGAGIAFPTYDQYQGRVAYGAGILNAILPYFHSFIKNILLLENGMTEEVRETNISTDGQQSDEDSVSSSESDQDGSSSVASSDASDASGLMSPLATSPEDHAAGGLAQLLALDISVSSLAERYYAHEAFKELVGSSSISSGAPSSSLCASGANSNNNTAPVSANAPLSSSPESLDYVITQIDIARMVRNASRHLDVESILSLPTITYKSKKKQSEEEDRREESHSNNQTRRDQATTSIEEGVDEEDLNWSWMMVGEMDGLGQCEPPSVEVPRSSTTHERDTTKTECAFTEEGQLISDIDEDTCVICLEHFIDGDRLRVLPCDHSFHVGCIDKWLSGSLSDQECFTSGCPTCKKHPVPIPCEQDEDIAGSTSNDGSVPSWAFTRLGGVMADSGSISSC